MMILIIPIRYSVCWYFYQYTWFNFTKFDIDQRNVFWAGGSTTVLTHILSLRARYSCMALSAGCCVEQWVDFSVGNDSWFYISIQLEKISTITENCKPRLAGPTWTITHSCLFFPRHTLDLRHLSTFRPFYLMQNIPPN